RADHDPAADRVFECAAERAVLDDRGLGVVEAEQDPAKAPPLVYAALSQESRSKGNGQVNMSHGSAFVSPTSLCGRDHSARDLALSPLHPELPRRGGTARRAWARRLI